MKCTVCGEGVLKSRRQAYVYREAGLGDGVTLLDVEVRHCSKCGASEPVIPRIAELHRQIALTLTRKPGPLTGREVRFLRTYLGYSSKDFAALIDVRPETASRWETDAQKITLPYDALLRTLVAFGRRVESYDEGAPTAPAELLALVAQRRRSTRVKMRSPTKGHTWAGQLAVAA